LGSVGLVENHMTDITDRRVIVFKVFLFLFGGILASILLILEQPTLKVGLLLLLAIWCFARFYYFVFYVIEHYVDSEYKFSGLLSFARYLLGTRKSQEKQNEDSR
jgi:hypothetical protein